MEIWCSISSFWRSILIVKVSLFQAIKLVFFFDPEICFFFLLRVICALETVILKQHSYLTPFKNPKIWTGQKSWDGHALLVLALKRTPLDYVFPQNVLVNYYHISKIWRNMYVYCPVHIFWIFEWCDLLRSNFIWSYLRLLAVLYAILAYCWAHGVMMSSPFQFGKLLQKI